MARNTQFSMAVGIVALVGGCAAPQPRAPESTRAAPDPPPASAPAAIVEPADLPHRDPLAYLRRVRDVSSSLDQYHVIFIRRERRGLGLLKSLHEPERIECWFRRSPFSIRMKWLDPDIKYGESTYVAGQDGDRLRFTPRPQLLNLPYRVYRVSPLTPVNWGECRYPVTEFGVAMLLDLTLANIDADPGGTRVTYVGRETAAASQRPVHRIRIDYPPAKNPAPVQELLIDAATNIPLYTEMRFADGAIDTSYAFEDLDASVRLSDADFLLDYDRTRSAATTAGEAR